MSARRADGGLRAELIGAGALAPAEMLTRRTIARPVIRIDRLGLEAAAAEIVEKVPAHIRARLLEGAGDPRLVAYLKAALERRRQGGSPE